MFESRLELFKVIMQDYRESFGRLSDVGRDHGFFLCGQMVDFLHRLLRRIVARECRKRMRKEQEQRNDPSTQKMKPSTSKLFPLCPHCQRTNHPPEKSWTGPNAANRPKRFKQEYPADNRNDGQDQGNLTHAGPSSILKKSLN